MTRIGLDWARFNVPLDTFQRRWGDCGISQDCSRSQSPQCVQCWVMCARPLLITVVCMCIIWKALCPYILDAQLGLWVSLEHTFTCVSTTNQAERRSSTAHLLARWEHERTTARWSRSQGDGSQRWPEKDVKKLAFDLSVNVVQLTNISTKTLQTLSEIHDHHYDHHNTLKHFTYPNDQWTGS